MAPEAEPWGQTVTLSAWLLEMQCKSGVSFRISGQFGCKPGYTKGISEAWPGYQRENKYIHNSFQNSMGDRISNGPSRNRSVFF